MQPEQGRADAATAVSLKQTFDCPHDECGKPDSVVIVGYCESSPQIPLGKCTSCPGWTMYDPPEVMVGDPEGLKTRKATHHQHGRVCINKTGREMGLGKFAGPF